jgi:wobble nucleotide-excising tRNase
LEQNINNKFTLQEVFSEGEQKSVALANFITELRISGKNGPVVFDDPVNSLDHERISIVAKRLIQLSLERQMIIFTHNVLLFYAIEQIIKDSKINISYNYYSVEKDLEYTGYLYENVPPHKESFKTYEAKINVILNSPKEVRTQRESKLAQEGYNHLRSAIELLVEDEIFKQVVKRYKRNIMFGQFEKINGTTLDVIKQELTEAFNQCCSYIEAHSNPEELAELPILEQLNRDFIKIKEIRKLFPQ